MIPGIAAWLVEKIGGKALLYIGAFLAGAALLAGAYQTGKNAERKRGEAATLRNEIKVLRSDLAAAKAAETAAQIEADRLAAAAKKDEGTTREIDDDLAKRKPEDRGLLSRRDADRLRRIR